MPEKIKVLFVSNLFPDTAEPYRGLDNAALLHRLAGKFEIRVVSPRPVPPFFPALKKICREEERVFSPVYPRTAYVPKIGSRLNHLLMARALGPALRSVRREFPFEALLSSWIYPDGCAVSRLARALEIPFVAVAQGSDVHQYLNIPARRKIIARSMATASAVITRSAELGRLLNLAGVSREKLHTVYNGIDFTNFTPGDLREARRGLGLREEVPILLFVGNFLPVKNPLLMVAAHAALCRVEPFSKCLLILIGGGPMEEKIRDAARTGGFGDQVLIVGRKNSSEVAAYMRAADLLCLPSENEGVPNVILEAFASGLRVVASRVGGIPEVLNQDHLGRLVEPGNLPELAGSFTALLSEPPKTGAIRDHALHFSWERAVAAYSAQLEKAAGR